METIVYSHSASVSFHPIVSVPVCCVFKGKSLHYPYVILPNTADTDFCVVDFFRKKTVIRGILTLVLAIFHQ